jgi:hypothetical protein
VYYFRDLAAHNATIAHTVFSIEETLVLQIAEHDDVSTVRTPGRVARFFAWLFAFRSVAPLANARLEALRRAAVFARIDGHVPAREVEALIGFGFSPAQLASLGAAA